MNNPGYFIDSIGNQQVFRCLKCQYDVFSRDSMQYHTKNSCPPTALPEDSMTNAEWIEHLQPELPLLQQFKVGISLLTWNTAEASKYAAMNVSREVKLLSNLGIKASIFWADNSSTDDTKPLLNAILGSNLGSKSMFSTNIGQSKARNDLRKSIIDAGCDFWLMVDGDIEITPNSSIAMLRFMVQRRKSLLGCIGMYCRNCTHERDIEVAQYCRKIASWMVTGDPEIAWTNYGMFSRSVFEKIAFDETGPFDGPGWGFEDDDYYLQMQKAEFYSLNTKYFRHMHRRRHSSLTVLGMKEALIQYKARQSYMATKWHGTRRMEVLVNQTMPVLEY